MQKISQSTSWELKGASDLQKGIYRSMKNWIGVKKEGGEWAGPNMHPKGREAESGVRSLYQCSQFGQRGGIWGTWIMKQLICDWMEWESHRQFIPCPYIPQIGHSPQECVAGRSWSIGIGEQFHSRDCCWWQGDGPRCGRETVVGNAFGGKLGSHGVRVWLLSCMQVLESPL